jgi:hypothetical protein
MTLGITRKLVWGLMLPSLIGAMYSCGSSGDSGNPAAGGSNLPAGSTCTSNSSCASGLCTSGSCSSGQPGGGNCTTDADCASGVCQSGACTGNGQGVPAGGSCTSNGQCASGTCTSGTCASGSGLADGASCGAPSECASGACTNGVCGTGTSGGPDGSVASGGATGSGGGGNAGSTGAGAGANGSPCTTGADCSSALCVSGVCTPPSAGTPGAGTTTTGPQFGGSGSGFRPLTAGCGPDTANQCTGTCEQKGGDPNVVVIRPPATLCFSGAGDPTPNDPGVVIEQSIETLNGVTYIHLRVTFDPHFVDNTYGTGSVGWNPNRPHTFNGDLTKSDHTELLLTDASGATIINFKIDYITADPSQSCGYGTLGVTGGDGSVISGDPTKVLAISTSLTRNLNGCGYCQNAACEGGDCTVNSPATDADFTPNAGTPNWDYRAVYEVWIDASAFGNVGFGQAFMTYVHASPAKASTDTIQVTPIPCPPTWDKPYCPPSVIREGGNCFGSPPGGGGAGGAGNGGAGNGGTGNGGTAGAAGNGGYGGGTVTPCPINWQIYISTEGKSTCTPIPFANYPGMAPCPAGYTIDVASEGRYCLPSP